MLTELCQVIFPDPKIYMMPIKSSNYSNSLSKAESV